jgi:peptidyl-prolyl cis-trans isomerase C
MTERLNLSLPPRPEPALRLGTVKALLLLLLAVSVAVLAAVLWTRPAGVPRAGVVLPAETIKELALKLEKQDLVQPAVAAWREYLEAAAPDREEGARVWYRVGKLLHAAGRPDEALEAYYRSEACAPLAELRDELGRRAQECLESLGKVTALRHELTGRVAADDRAKAGADEILAEIGSLKITRADLDLAIERQVENQLAVLASVYPPDALREQKEATMREWSGDEARGRFLQQMVLEETLYRKAREEHLHDDAATRRQLQDMERKMLAKRVYDRALAERIQITPLDAQNHYAAHKDLFREPEQAQISHILLKDQEAAEQAIKQIEAGGAFAELAARLSTDEATKASGGQLPAAAYRDGRVPGVGVSKEAADAIFSTPAGKVVPKPVKSDRGWHAILVRSRQAERERSFEEVGQEVHQQLYAAKQQELRQALMDELTRRYDVVIHTSRLKPRTPDAEAQIKDKGKPK